MDNALPETLQAFLSDPSMIKAISSLAGKVNTDISGEAKEALPSANEHADKTFEVQSQYGSLNAINKERINLLKALRPFLVDSRQEKVDSLIRALGTAELLSKAMESGNLLSGKR